MKIRNLHAIGAFFILLAVLASFFFPAIFRSKIVAPLDITTTLFAPWSHDANGKKPYNHNPTDAVTQYLPYRIFAEKSFREDGYIGWNEYEMGGYSLAGNTMALPGTWTMQLHRFLPFKDAWNLGIIAEFLIAGAGMLVFLRSRNLPWIPSLIGAIAFMANSQFTIWIYHRWALSSFCWMPWVLWSGTSGFHWKSPSFRQLLLPVFLALALLGGSLQHMVFIVVACSCLIAGSIPKLSKTLKSTPYAVGWFCAFIVALGIAAFAIVPQVQGYLTNIDIGHTRGGLGYKHGALQPLLNFFAIPLQIWPWLVGDNHSIDGWRLLKSNFMHLAYLGSIPMLLGVCGLFIPSMPRQAKWLVVVGLLIPITPLVGPLYHRVQLVFLLGAAWMFAEMLAALPRITTTRFVKYWSLFVILIGFFLLVGTCLPQRVINPIQNQVVAKSLQAAEKSQFGNDPAWIANRARNWVDRFSLSNPRTAWTYGLLLLGSAGLALSSSNGKNRQYWGNLAIMGSVTLELFTFFQSWTTFSNPEQLRPQNQSIDQVRDLAGTSYVYQGHGKSSSADTFAAPNLLSLYNVRSIDAYESIQYRTVAMKLPESPPEQLLTLAGVKLSIQRANNAPYEGTVNWPIVASLAENFTVRQNPEALPAVMGGSDSVPQTVEQLMPSLRKASEVASVRETMNRMEFDWPAGAEWIRVAQNWHPGWHWKADDGPWVAVQEGPDAACWISKPNSECRHVELKFFPRPQWLVLTSISIFVMWLAFALITKRPRIGLPSSQTV